VIARESIYRYLTFIFELVSLWQQYNIADVYAGRAMCPKVERPAEHLPAVFCHYFSAERDPAKGGLSEP